MEGRSGDDILRGGPGDDTGRDDLGLGREELDLDASSPPLTPRFEVLPRFPSVVADMTVEHPAELAYAELVFIDVAWADLTADHVAAAIDDFANRRRRFGGLDE